MIAGYTNWVSSVTFSPDGRTLVTASGHTGIDTPGEVKLCDPVAGYVRAILSDVRAPGRVRSARQATLHRGGRRTGGVIGEVERATSSALGALDLKDGLIRAGLDGRRQARRLGRSVLLGNGRLTRLLATRDGRDAHPVLPDHSPIVGRVGGQAKLPVPFNRATRLIGLPVHLNVERDRRAARNGRSVCVNERPLDRLCSRSTLTATKRDHGTSGRNRRRVLNVRSMKHLRETRWREGRVPHQARQGANPRRIISYHCS